MSDQKRWGAVHDDGGYDVYVSWFDTLQEVLAHMAGYCTPENITIVKRVDVNLVAEVDGKTASVQVGNVAE